MIFCDECGASMHESNGFWICKDCGHKMPLIKKNDAVAATITSPQPIKKAAVKTKSTNPVCDLCGHVNGLGATICEVCKEMLGTHEQTPIEPIVKIEPKALKNVRPTPEGKAFCEYVDKWTK